MVKRIALLILSLLFLMNCYYMGCYSLEDACYECCKEALKPMKRTMGSKRAWEAREPCTEECIDFAEARDKDGYWVEKNKACLLGTVNYFE